MADETKPYVPASSNIPEFTLQAVLLGIGLSLIMCAANIYVGLYAGMTVSAAIPASVISMGVLRGLMKRGTILENNIVHTIASSGESLAAGIIFTVPALVLLGLWSGFNYWETTLIAAAGGVMGVVMMIPLRKPMIIEQKELKYPEGVACAEVLKAGDKGGTEMAGIFSALALGALFKSLVSVVGVFRGTAEGAWRVGRTGLYLGTDISPMLMAVGFIVGFEISLLVFLGGAISYFGALPFLAFDANYSGSTTDVLWDIWDEKIRYFGIGAMVVAGIYSIIKIAGSMGAALKTVFKGIRGQESTADLPRTEQGISGTALVTLLVGSLLLSGFVYFIMLRPLTSAGMAAGTAALISVLMFVLAFFFVAVASYIVGLVGSSNSPVSGMTICTVLITAGLLLAFGYTGSAGMIATLGVAGVVCCATCTSGDICQDLKIGQIVGATPRRLQTGELIGTIVPAFIIAPTMQLLHLAYGIGTPAREGVKALKAPQGVMFEKLIRGLFGAGDIPWTLVGIGAAVGLAAILIDRLFLEPRKSKFRLHAMPLAVGMYLPLSVTAPLLIGGFAYLWVVRKSKKRGDSDEEHEKVVHRGLLFSSGLVAGEAIMGILIAILLALQLDLPLMDWAEPTKLGLSKSWEVAGDVISLVALLAVTGLLVRKALTRAETSTSQSENGTV